MNTIAILIIGILTALSAYAQGTVDFKNKAITATGYLDAPVFLFRWHREA